MLAQPYVSPAAFKAHPTFLDLLNLRSGDLNADDQDAELVNILRMASAWADRFVAQGLPNGALGAHSAVDQCRVRVGRDGLLRYHPNHTPVVSVESIGIGATPSVSTTYTAPQVWIEDGRTVVFDPSGSSPWSGGLQFGAPSAGGEVYARWAYTAGYPNCTLSSNSAAAATSITVGNPAGIVPGSVLRIWDPGYEEVITVGAGYTAGSTTVPLTTGLAYAHDGTVDMVSVSGLPDDVHLAVIHYAVVLLMRPDTTAEDAYAGARVGPDSRQGDARTGGAGLLATAEELLLPYCRVR